MQGSIGWEALLINETVDFEASLDDWAAERSGYRSSKLRSSYNFRWLCREFGHRFHQRNETLLCTYEACCNRWQSEFDGIEVEWYAMASVLRKFIPVFRKKIGPKDRLHNQAANSDIMVQTISCISVPVIHIPAAENVESVPRCVLLVESNAVRCSKELSPEIML